KHLFQGYLNIYNNYFKAPWMPDRTEANPNELNQDDARYGFRCCHLKNIWTAPLPPETELSRQMTTSTTSIDIMGLQARSEERRVGKERRSASGREKRRRGCAWTTSRRPNGAPAARRRAAATRSRPIFLSRRRRHTSSVSAFLLNRSSDLLPSQKHLDCSASS